MIKVAYGINILASGLFCIGVLFAAKERNPL